MTAQSAGSSRASAAATPLVRCLSIWKAELLRMCADEHGVVVALGNHILLVSWTGHFRAVLDPFQAVAAPRQPADTSSRSAQQENAQADIVAVAHDADCSTLALLLANGAAALCCADALGNSALASIELAAWLVSPGGGATCCAVSARASMVAVGCSDGVLRLWNCANVSAGMEARELSLADWGYGPEGTGSVGCIAWTQDGQVRQTPCMRLRLSSQSANDMSYRSAMTHVCRFI